MTRLRGSTSSSVDLSGIGATACPINSIVCTSLRMFCGPTQLNFVRICDYGHTHLSILGTYVAVCAVLLRFDNVLHTRASGFQLPLQWVYVYVKVYTCNIVVVCVCVVHVGGSAYGACVCACVHMCFQHIMGSTRGSMWLQALVEPIRLHEFPGRRRPTIVKLGFQRFGWERRLLREDSLSWVHAKNHCKGAHGRNGREL